MRSRSTWWPAIVALFLAFGILGTVAFEKPAGAAERRLPDLDVLLKSLRRNLRGDEGILSQYRYRQKLTRFDRDGSGTLTNTSVRVYDARPDVWGAPSNRLLIEEDGQPVPERELVRRHEERRERSAEAAARRSQERPAERRERLERRAKRQREREEILDDVFRVSQGRIVGRETLNGYPTVVLEFSPRPGVEPSTNEGRVLSKSAGRAWIDEDDHQIVRLEVKAIDTITYGWGVVVRLHEGTSIELERRRVNDEVWLPTFYRLTGGLRMLLVRTRRFDVLSEFSDYRRIADTVGRGR